MIARRNSPVASGEPSRHATLTAPEDSPKSVTFSGSPPNASMFSRTHFSAASWSRRPRFVTPPSSGRNPSIPSRYCTVTRTAPARANDVPS